MDFLERYKFDFKKDLLGFGGFGEVYKAFDSLLNREVALKFYKGGASQKYDLLSEIKNIYHLRHQNLLEFYDATILRQKNAIGRWEDLQVGVMEYASEGDLTAFLATNPTKDEIKIVMLGILAGMDFMHNHGFIHRDLKPQNILFVKKGKRITPKIADFSISKNTIGDNQPNSTKLIGTVEYMAPEQFNKKFAIRGKPSFNLDLWSLGVIIYELLKGELPFGKRNKSLHSEQIMHNICYEGIPKELDTIEEPFRTVLSKCLVKDANKRVKTARELIDFVVNYKPSSSPSKALQNVSDKKEMKSSKELSNEEKVARVAKLREEFSKPKEESNTPTLVKRVLIAFFVFVLLFAGYMLLKPKSKINENVDKIPTVTEIIRGVVNYEGLEALEYLDSALLKLDGNYVIWQETQSEPNASSSIFNGQINDIVEYRNQILTELDSLEKSKRYKLDVDIFYGDYVKTKSIKNVWEDEATLLSEELFSYDEETVKDSSVQ